MASRKFRSSKRRIKRRNTRKKGGLYGYDNPYKTLADNRRNCELWKTTDLGARYQNASNELAIDPATGKPFKFKCSDLEVEKIDFPGRFNGFWAKPKKRDNPWYDASGFHPNKNGYQDYGLKQNPPGLKQNTPVETTPDWVYTTH